MADFNSHLLQAEHNSRVACALLNRPDHRDWAITVTFYCALHLITAGLIHLNENPDSHHKCKLLIQQKFKSCFRPYSNLFDASWKVRYIRDYCGSDDKPSCAYYNQQDAKEFYMVDLEKIFRELKQTLPQIYSSVKIKTYHNI